VREVLQTANKDIMGKSSIHVRGVNSSSELHNERGKKLSYVRADLTPLNSSFKVKSISTSRKEIEEKYRASTGQRMQSKAEPIREGVLLIERHHTAEDLKRLAQKIEQRFGIRTIQGHCHKDEGHYDKLTKEWKPNYHAHMVFEWTHQDTGKNVRMKREDMAELQSLVASELGLERGVSSSKKHLNSLQYKNAQEEKDLQRTLGVQNGLSKAVSIIKQADSLDKEIEPLKTAKKGLETDLTLLQTRTQEYAQQAEREKQKVLEQQAKAQEEKLKVQELEQQKQKLSTELGFERVNLKYLKEKTEEQRTELSELKEQKQQIQRSTGLKR
jgi:hypothetical protein